MHADHLSCSFPKLVFEYVSATKEFSSINFYHLVENVFVFVYVNNSVGAVEPTSFRYTDTAFVLVTFSLQYKHGQHTYMIPILSILVHFCCIYHVRRVVVASYSRPKVVFLRTKTIFSSYANP